MSDDHLVGLEEFRATAGEWIRAHLDREDGPGRSTTRMTPDRVAEERTIQRKLYDGGYAGISWPEAYGGRGLTVAHEHAFNDVARGFRLPDFGVLGRTTFGICIPTVLAFASPEFLKHHLPKVLVGEELWVQFFSEPEAGSDLAGVRMRATRDGDRWILSGSKIWSSGAYYADYALCLARTDWDVPKHRGLTWFAVNVRAPGVDVQPILQINGNAEFCQEYLDDVEVAPGDVIGEVNRGWAVARFMLAAERGGGHRGAVAAAAPGESFAPDLVALARRLGREHEPEVQQLVARAHVLDVVESELLRRVIALGDAGKADPASLAAYTKLAAGTFTPARARLGLAIGRAAAVVWNDDGADDLAEDAGHVALAFLNGRGQSIAGGTNEMMRNVIGEQLLGLPREPSFDVDRPFAEVIRRASGDWQAAR